MWFIKYFITIVTVDQPVLLEDEMLIPAQQLAGLAEFGNGMVPVIYYTVASRQNGASS